MLMAASAVVVVPTIVLFFFAQRTFIQGITLTGILPVGAISESRRRSLQLRASSVYNGRMTADERFRWNRGGFSVARLTDLDDAPDCSLSKTPSRTGQSCVKQGRRHMFIDPLPW